MNKILLTGLLTVVGLALPALDLALGEGGITATVPGMGGRGISYPKLEPGGLKPVQVKVSGTRADLTYAQGITATVDRTKDGTIELRFANLPASIEKFHLSTMIGPEYGDGGSFTMAGGTAKPFPAQQPEKPFLFQGNTSGITISDAAGRSLAISGLPDFAFHQVQDNREWGWKIFQWQVWVPINRAWTQYSFRISGETPKVIPKQVDRFGQTTRKDFPGKISSEHELVADRADDEAYYAGLSPRELDAYGGVPGSGAKLGFTGSGFFRVEQKDGKWYLLTPEGNVTFHLGICTFGFAPGEDATDVSDRRDIYEWLPPNDGDFAAAWHPETWWHDKAFSFYAANLIRKYGKDVTKEAQLGRLVDRVRAMGFNSIGAFSGNNDVFMQKRIPRVEHIGVGPALPGIRGVPDPFDAETLARMDASWSKSLPAKKDDPLIIGYFFANEQGLEDIPRGVPKLPGKHAAKQKLVEILRGRYADIAAFNAAWAVEAASFEALADMPLPVSTKAAFADMEAYTEVFLDAYHKAITETCRKYDPNHLLIGNRWQPGTANSEVLCRSAGKYMDVISINYYALGVDRAFVDRLQRWTGGKPQMWSEFYYTSGAESNAAASGLDMATQRERGLAYRQYVEQAAATGYVVGVEWFTLIDQAVTGRWFERTTGERNNTGIFNVADRPYKDLVEGMAAANRGVYEVLLDSKAAYVLDDPRFSGAGRRTHRLQAGRIPRGSQQVDGSGDGWPGRPPERIGSERLVSGKTGEGLEAAIKVCWDEDHLYLLATVTDPTPMQNPRSGDRLWNGDGIEVFVGSEDLDRSGTLLFSDRQVLLGAKADGERHHVVNAADQVAIPMAVLPAPGGYVLEAAIPWAALGTTPAEGKELIFDLAIDDADEGGARIRQLMWNGGPKNSSDRSYWGRLTLVP